MPTELLLGFTEKFLMVQGILSNLVESPTHGLVSPTKIVYKMTNSASPTAFSPKLQLECTKWCADWTGWIPPASQHHFIEADISMD